MISLLIAVALAGAPRVAVVVHTTGFADDDAKRVQEKVSQEVAATGVELWALSKALEVKTECLTDHTCAKEVLRTADATFLVWIEALRAGGQVELEAHLLDAEGRSVAQDESAARADDVIGGGGVVPQALLSPLKNAAAPSTTTTTPATTSTTAKVEPLALEKSGDVEPPPKALSPLAIGGIAALGAGALLAIGGGAVAVSQYNVTQDPSALGAAKTDAAPVFFAMLAVAGVGVAAAGTGGALLVLGM